MHIPALPTPAPWRLLVLALACGAALCGPAQAQWKWRDKSGQMHISDIPPPADVAERDILTRPPRAAVMPPGGAASDAAPATPVASAPVARTEPELEARRSKAEQDEKAKRQALEDANSAAKADNCQRAKRQLIALENGQRISRTNDKGEREILDDKGRAEETQHARNIIASDCK